jgi:NADPH-dependent glutamate synthase beta subunit-like oxidoreductase
VVNFELLPKPPQARADNNPWPQWPKIYRVDYGHSESEKAFGKDPREFLITTKKFVGDADGNLTAVVTKRVEWTKNAQGAFIPQEVEGSEQTFECDLCFLAMGFLGPEKTIIDELQLAQDPRSNIKGDFGVHTTSANKVFAAGDCRRGQSLVVWAIREGREAAREIDRFLMGTSSLP